MTRTIIFNYISGIMVWKRNLKSKSLLDSSISSLSIQLTNVFVSLLALCKMGPIKALIMMMNRSWPTLGMTSGHQKHIHRIENCPFEIEQDCFEMEHHYG